MTTPRITVCVPIYGRPQRTARLIECLKNQTINNYELWLIGDGCPQWEIAMQTQEMQDDVKKQRQLGNFWHTVNLPHNYGGFGHHIRNCMKFLASAPYLCFIDNDDVVKNNHLEHYLSKIENTFLDFVYYNTWNNALGILRDTQPTAGLIGHSELCIRTEFFRQVPLQTQQYGHDWQMIEWMLLNSSHHMKGVTNEWTYKVMGTPAKRETDID